MGGSLPGIGPGIITRMEVRETQMADERRHEWRNARRSFATGDFGLRTRAVRQRFLPTEHGHAALPFGATCGYQSDSSSKRPVSSVISVSRRTEGTLPFLRPKPLPRLSGEAKERKQTMKIRVREPCRQSLTPVVLYQLRATDEASSGRLEGGDLLRPSGHEQERGDEN